MKRKERLAEDWADRHQLDLDIEVLMKLSFMGGWDRIRYEIYEHMRDRGYDSDDLKWLKNFGEEDGEEA